MRRSWTYGVGAALALSCVSGCAVDAIGAAGTVAALESQATEAARTQEDAARSAAARLALTQVARAADVYAALNGGSTAGFATDFVGDGAAGQLASLTDTSAQIAVGGGQCVTVALPSGEPVEGPC